MPFIGFRRAFFQKFIVHDAVAFEFDGRPDRDQIVHVDVRRFGNLLQDIFSGHSEHSSYSPSGGWFPARFCFLPDLVNLLQSFVVLHLFFRNGLEHGLSEGCPYASRSVRKIPVREVRWSRRFPKHPVGLSYAFSFC